MAYEHGAYGVIGEPLARAAISTETIVVFYGGVSGITGGGTSAVKEIHSLEEFDEAFPNSTSGSARLPVEAAFMADERPDKVVVAAATTAATWNADLVKTLTDAVYSELHLIPSILVPCVGVQAFESSTSYAWFSAASKNIAGVWPEAEVFIPAEDMDGAPEGLPANFGVFYGLVSAGGKEIPLVYLRAIQQAVLDARNGGIPFETVSNKVIGWAGAKATETFDRTTGNEMNAAGLNCAIYLEGLRHWGDHTAVYRYSGTTDADKVFMVTRRMQANVLTWFIKANMNRIDKPMTRSLRDTILIEAQEHLEYLVSIGALIGSPRISFEATSNPTSEMIQGRFRFDAIVTPSVPMTSAKLSVSFSDSGFDVLLG